MDVTPANTLVDFLIVRSFNPSFAIVPSPHPNSKSPFNSWVIHVIPRENCFFTGPILLKINFYKLISIKSPDLVVQYALVSVGSMITLMICLFKFPNVH